MIAAGGFFGFQFYTQQRIAGEIGAALEQIRALYLIEEHIRAHKLAGIVQSLLVTCRLHGIDPYTYLVDVLQRVGEHPASRVAELTPRRWKQLFAANPLRSDLHTLRG